MAKTKMTKREKFEALANLAEVKANPMLSEFVAHELDLLAKKNASGAGKMTATQVANEGIKAEILDGLANEPNRMFTVSEMQKAIPCCAELSNQRISALVRQLVADGKVERIEDKRKAFFKYIG
jgi:predicted transcriptional regulator